ncbi:MAG: DNA primase DnaG [Candidatus Bathyarchaeota archaeon]|nr:DNA primase DnaG [Candidatus Bathyarchaeota archaeon]MDH5701165.1 DNA primase DnaG [Candidatus Bathyarchaeota archaeon]
MKSSQTVTVKYVIRTRFEVEGVVEKPDVIGAVFGQTEGLFGPELDLRELQKSGRIGRIEISLESKQDKTTGTITIPTSLDRVSTAIIAASIESINRVGPCEAKVTLDKIEDIRDARRRTIIDRAKEVLHEWTLETMPGTDEIFREVSETLRLARVEKYGPDGLTAGPDIESAKEIIIVEGRADVINMLKTGIQNVIALEGAKIPQTIIKLCREKEATAFLDGDRGGDLILKELLQVTDVKYIARAPPGKEVEELSPKKIEKALKEKVPIGKIKAKKARRKILVPQQIVKTAKELEGTLEAVLLNNKMQQIERLPVSELAEKLQGIKDVDTVIFDGVITQRLVDVAAEKNIKFLVAARVSEAIKQPLQVNLLTFTEI